MTNITINDVLESGFGRDERLIARRQLITLIESILEEVIGKDEKITEFSRGDVRIATHNKNRLRAEQRALAKKIIKEMK